MRLRHKKPLNSYVGQAIPDNNQAQDEDFIKNSFSNKKNKYNKQKPVDQKSKRYSQILCKFINSVNFNYRNFNKQNQAIVDQKTGQKELDDLKIMKTNEQENKGNLLEKFEEVVLKQQQKIQKNIKQTIAVKKIKKQKHKIVQMPKKKLIKQIPTLNVSVQKKEKQQNIPFNSKNNIKFPTFQPIIQQPLNNLYSFPTADGNTNIQQLLQLKLKMLQSNLAANIDPISFYSMAQLMNYQMLINQNMRMNMGQFQPSNVQTNNYIPLNKLPFSVNFDNNQKQLSAVSSQFPKKTQNIQKSQIIKPEIKHNDPSQYEQNLFTNQPIHFKKKSSFHIAIAFNIHFSNLKQQGLSLQNNLDYSKIDPTFASKKMRNRKISDNMTHIHQPMTNNF